MNYFRDDDSKKKTESLYDFGNLYDLDDVYSFNKTIDKKSNKNDNEISVTRAYPNLERAGLTKDEIKKLYISQYVDRTENRNAKIAQIQAEFEQRLGIASPEEIESIQAEYANKVAEVQEEQKRDDAGEWFNKPLERYDINPFNPYASSFSKLEAKKFNATASMQEKLELSNKMHNAKIANLDNYVEREITLIDGDSFYVKDGIFGGKTEARASSKTGKFNNLMFDAIDGAWGQTMGVDNTGSMGAMSVASNKGRDAVKLYRQNELVRQILGKDADDYITATEIDNAKAFANYIALKRYRGEIDGRTDIEAYNPTKVDYYKQYFEDNKTFKAYVRDYKEKDKFGRNLMDIGDINKGESIVADMAYNPYFNAAFDVEALNEHFEATKNFNQYVIANQYKQDQVEAKAKQDAEDKDGFIGEEWDIFKARCYQLFGSVPAFFDTTEKWISENLMGMQAGSFRKQLYEQDQLNALFGVRADTWANYVKDMQDAEKAFQDGDYIKSIALVGMNAGTLISTSLPDMIAEAALMGITGGLGTAAKIGTTGLSKIASLHARRYFSGWAISGTAQTLQDMMEFEKLHGRQMTTDEVIRSSVMNGFGFYLETALSGGMIGRLLPGPSKYIISTPRQVASRGLAGIGLGVLEEAGTEAVQEYIQNSISQANVNAANGNYFGHLTTELGLVSEHGFEALAGAVTGGIMSGITSIPRLGVLAYDSTMSEKEANNALVKFQTHNFNGIKFDENQIQASHNTLNTYYDSIGSIDADPAIGQLEAVDLYKKLLSDVENMTMEDYASAKAACIELLVAYGKQAELDTQAYADFINEIFELTHTEEQAIAITDLATRRRAVTKYLLSLLKSGSDDAELFNKITIQHLKNDLGVEEVPIDETITIGNKLYIKSLYDKYVELARIVDPNLTEDAIKEELSGKTTDQVHDEIMYNSRLGHDIAHWLAKFNVFTDKVTEAEKTLDDALSLAFAKAYQNGDTLTLTLLTGTNLEIPITQNYQTDLEYFRSIVKTQLRLGNESVVKQIGQWLSKYETTPLALNAFKELKSYEDALLREATQMNNLLTNQTEKYAGIVDAVIDLELNPDTTTAVYEHYSPRYRQPSKFKLNIFDLLKTDSPQSKLVESIFEEAQELLNLKKAYLEMRGIDMDSDAKEVIDFNKQQDGLNQKKVSYEQTLNNFLQNKYTNPSNANQVAKITYARVARLFAPYLLEVFKRNLNNQFDTIMYAKACYELKKKSLSQADFKKWQKKSKSYSQIKKQKLEALKKLKENFKTTSNLATLMNHTFEDKDIRLTEYENNSQEIKKDEMTIRGLIAGLSENDRNLLRERFNELFVPIQEHFKDSFGENDNFSGNISEEGKAKVKDHYPTNSIHYNLMYAISFFLNKDKRILELSSNPLFRDVADLRVDQVDTDSIDEKIKSDFGNVYKIFGIEGQLDKKEKVSEETKKLLEVLASEDNQYNITINKVEKGGNTVYYISEDDYNKLPEEISVELKTGFKRKSSIPSPAMLNGVENPSAYPYYTLADKRTIVKVYKPTSANNINSTYEAIFVDSDNVSDNTTMEGIKNTDAAHYTNANLKVKDGNGNEYDFIIARMASEHYTDGTDSSAILKCKTREEASKLYEKLHNGKTVDYIEWNSVKIDSDTMKAHLSIANDWFYNLAMNETGLINEYTQKTDVTFYENTTWKSDYFSNARALVLAMQQKTSFDEFKKLYGEATENGYSNKIEDYVQMFGSKSDTKAKKEAEEIRKGNIVTAKKQELHKQGLLIKDTEVDNLITAKLARIFPPSNTVSVYGLNFGNVAAIANGLTREQKMQLYTQLQYMEVMSEEELAILSQGLIFNTDKEGTDPYNTVYHHFQRLISQIKNLDPLAAEIEKAGLGSQSEALNELNSKLDLDEKQYDKKIDYSLNVTSEMVNLIEALADQGLKELLLGIISVYTKKGETKIDEAFTAKKRGYLWLRLQEYYRQHKETDFDLNAITKECEYFQKKQQVTIGDITYANPALTRMSVDDFSNKYPGREMKKVSTIFSYNEKNESGVFNTFIPDMTDAQGNSVCNEDPIYYVEARNSRFETTKQVINFYENIKQSSEFNNFDKTTKDALDAVYSNSSLLPDTKIQQMVNILYNNSLDVAKIASFFNTSNTGTKLDVNDYIQYSLKDVDANTNAYMEGSFNFAGEEYKFNDLFDSNVKKDVAEHYKQMREHTKIEEVDKPEIRLGNTVLQSLNVTKLNVNGNIVVAQHSYNNDALNSAILKNNNISGNGAVLISETFIEAMLQLGEALDPNAETENDNGKDKKAIKLYKKYKKLTLRKIKGDIYIKCKSSKKQSKSSIKIGKDWYTKASKEWINKKNKAEAKIRKHNENIFKETNANKMADYLVNTINALSQASDGTVRIVFQAKTQEGKKWFTEKVKQKFKDNEKIKFINSNANVSDDVFNAFTAGMKMSDAQRTSFRNNNGAFLNAIFDDGIYSDYVVNFSPYYNQKYLQTLGRFNIALTGVFSSSVGTIKETQEKIARNGYVPLEKLTVSDLSNMNAENILDWYNPVFDDIENSDETETETDNDKERQAYIAKINTMLQNDVTGLLRNIQDNAETIYVDPTQQQQQPTPIEEGDYSLEVTEAEDADSDIDIYDNLVDFYENVIKVTTKDHTDIINRLFDVDIVQSVSENISSVNNTPAKVAEKLAQYDIENLKNNVTDQPTNTEIAKAIQNAVVNQESFDFDAATDFEKFLYVYYAQYHDVYSAIIEIKDSFSIKQYIKECDIKYFNTLPFIAPETEIIKTEEGRSVAFVTYKEGDKFEISIINQNENWTKRELAYQQLFIENKERKYNKKATINMRNFVSEYIVKDPNFGNIDTIVEETETETVNNQIKNIIEKFGEQSTQTSIKTFNKEYTIDSNDLLTKVTEYKAKDINSMSVGDLAKSSAEINLLIAAATNLNDNTSLAALTKIKELLDAKLNQNKDAIRSEEDDIKAKEEEQKAVERQKQKQQKKDSFKDRFDTWDTLTMQQKLTLMKEYADYKSNDLKLVSQEVQQLTNQLINNLKSITTTESILTDKAREEIITNLQRNETVTTMLRSRTGETLFGDTSIRKKLESCVNDENKYNEYIALIEQIKERTAITFDPTNAEQLQSEGYLKSAFTTFLSQQLSNKYLQGYKFKDSKGKYQPIDVTKLTPNQQVELLCVMMANDPTFNTVYKVAVTSQGFRIEMRDEVVMAMISGGYEVIKSNISQKDLDAETVGRMNGLDVDSMTTNQKARLMQLTNNVGSIRIQVQRQMGQAVCDALGIKYNNQEGLFFGESNYIEGLGKVVLQSITNIDRDKKVGLIRSEKTVSKQELRRIGFSTSRELAFIKFNNLPSSTFAQLAEVLTNNIMFDASHGSETFKINEAFADTSKDKYIKGTVWKLGRSDQDSLNFINRVLKQTAYTLNMDMINQMLENELALAYAKGYQFEEDLALLTPENRIAAEGSNRTILHDIRAIRMLKEKVDDWCKQNKKTYDDVQIYFDWEQMVSGRFQINGSIFNVQNNKLLRGCLLPKNSKVTHDTKKSEHVAYERLALAQGFDCMSETGRQGIDQLLNDTANDVSLAEKLVADYYALDDKTLEHKWQKYGIGREEYSQSLQCAIHILKRAQALSQGQAEFETTLMVEDDSTTSGYFLKLLMLPHPEILRMYGIKVGVFNTLQELRQNILGASWEASDIDLLKKMEGFYDIYKQAAVNTAQHLAKEDVLSDIYEKDEDGNVVVKKGLNKTITTNILEGLNNDNEDLSWDKIAKGLPQAEYENGVYKVSSELRKLLKPVVMVFGYSAGENSIRAKTGDELYQIVLKDLVELVSSNDFNSDILATKVNNFTKEQVDRYTGIAALFAANLKTSSFEKPKSKSQKDYRNFLISEDPDKGLLGVNATKVTETNRRELFKNLRRFQYFYYNAITANTSTDKYYTPFGSFVDNTQKGFSLDDVMIRTEGTPQSYSQIIINLFAQTYGNAVVKSLKPFRPFVQANNQLNIGSGIACSLYKKAYDNALQKKLYELNPELKKLTIGTEEYDAELARARNMLRITDVDAIRQSIEKLYPSNASFAVKRNDVTAINVLQSERASVETDTYLTIQDRYEKYSGKVLYQSNAKFSTFDIHGIFDDITSPGLRTAVFTTHNSDAVVLNKTVTWGYDNGMFVTPIHDALYHSYQYQVALGQKYNEFSVEVCSKFNILTDNLKVLEDIIRLSGGFELDLAILENDQNTIESYKEALKQQKQKLRNIIRIGSKTEKERCARLLNKLETQITDRGTLLSALDLDPITANSIRDFLGIEGEVDQFDSNAIFNSVTIADLLIRFQQQAKYYEGTNGQKEKFYASTMKVQNLGGLGSYKHNPMNNVTAANTSSYTMHSQEGNFVHSTAVTTLLSRADISKNGILEVFDKLVDNTVDSPAHIQRLRSFLEEFLNFDELQEWMINYEESSANTRGETDFTQRMITVQKQSQGHVPFGFHQSAVTVYVHEIIHAMFGFAFVQKDNAQINKNIARLRALYKYVIEHNLITIEDFLVDKQNYTQDEYDKAVRSYEYIFANKDTLSDRGLQEFLSYLLSNDMMIEKLSNHKINVADKTSIMEKIMGFVSNIFKVLTQQLTAQEAFTNLSKIISGEGLGKYNNVDIYTAAVMMCRDIQVANTHAGTAMARAAGTAQSVTDFVNCVKEKGNKVLSPALKRLVNIHGISNFVDTSAGSKSAILTKLLLTAPFNKNTRKGLYQFISTVSHRTHIDWVKSILDDMSQNDFGRQQIESIGTRTNALEMQYQSTANLVKSKLREAFGETLDEEGEVSLSEVLRGNLQCLYNNNNIDELLTLMTVESERRNKETSILMQNWSKFWEYEEKDGKPVEKEGTSVVLSNSIRNELRTFIKNAALLQAAVMINGKGNAVYSSYDNAYSFVVGKAKDSIDAILKKQGIHTGYSGKYGLGVYRNIAEKIDQLASLYYMDNTDQDMLKTASKLNKEGLDLFLASHQTYVRETVNLKGERERSKEAGIVPTARVNDAFFDFKIAPKSERKMWEWNGYNILNTKMMTTETSALNLQNATVNKDNEYVIYVRPNSVPLRRDGSIVSMIGTHDRTISSMRYVTDCIDLDQVSVDTIRAEVMNEFLGKDNSLIEAEVEARINSTKQDAFKQYLKKATDTGVKSLFNNSYSYKSLERMVLTSTFDGYQYKPYSYADERAMGMSDNAIELFGKMIATQTVSNDSYDQNITMLALLKDYYENSHNQFGKDVATGNKFVDIKQKLIETFGGRMQDLLEDEPHFYVREDWVNAVLGVESFSITEWKRADGRNVIPPSARKIFYYGEQFLRLIAFKNRENVVIKQPSTITGNIVSNFNIHMLTEPNVAKVGNKYLANTQATLRYEKDKQRLEELEFKEKVKGLNDAEKREKLRVEAAVENNPVHELASEGMLTNIVEDIKARDMESMSDVSSIFAHSNLVQNTPERIRKMFKFFYMEKGTPIYDFLYTTNKYSDFVARVTEYQLQMEKYKGNPDKNSDEYKEYSRKAKAEVWEAFIDYRMPVNRAEQYLNDIGFIWFAKYWRRIQRYIIKGILTNPIGVIMQVARNSIFHSDNMFLQLVGIKDINNLFTNPIEGVKRVITPKLTELLGVL